MRLNFRQLPTWLDEGLAEYYGDTVFGHSEVSIGRVNRYRLGYLQESQWFPLGTILKVDGNSPLYQKEFKAPLFYAESWLLVRHLLLDPEAVKAHRLQTYLQVWLRTGDAEEAARQGLGDLSTLQELLKRDLNRPVQDYQRMKPLELDARTELKIRDLSPAEGDLAEGLFLLRIQHPEEASPFIEKASRLAPDLAGIYTARGLQALARHDAPAADAAFSKAMDRAPADFLPAFLRGQALLDSTHQTAKEIAEATSSLETATRLNPGFAPAFHALE
jgi:tetratricopeptide (TPR) repeat protein